MFKRLLKSNVNRKLADNEIKNPYENLTICKYIEVFFLKTILILYI